MLLDMLMELWNRAAPCGNRFLSAQCQILARESVAPSCSDGSSLLKLSRCTVAKSRADLAVLLDNQSRQLNTHVVFGLRVCEIFFATKSGPNLCALTQMRDYLVTCAHEQARCEQWAEALRPLQPPQLPQLPQLVLGLDDKVLGHQVRNLCAVVNSGQWIVVPVPHKAQRQVLGLSEVLRLDHEDGCAMVAMCIVRIAPGLYIRFCMDGSMVLRFMHECNAFVLDLDVVLACPLTKVSMHCLPLIKALFIPECMDVVYQSWCGSNWQLCTSRHVLSAHVRFGSEDNELAAFHTHLTSWGTGAVDAEAKKLVQLCGFSSGLVLSTDPASEPFKNQREVVCSRMPCAIGLHEMTISAGFAAMDPGDGAGHCVAYTWKQHLVKDVIDFTLTGRDLDMKCDAVPSRLADVRCCAL
jgi:hypothetical protein